MSSAGVGIAPEEILAAALDVLQRAGPELGDTLDALPAPIYTTDASGKVTFFNRACTEFAGRTPQLGEDRWCVTWKLYTESGNFLPHEECPMALAIQERREIRGLEAVAERPDGSRVNFRPYPTPLFDGEGNLTGAVNMLIDVTDRKQAEFLKAQAQKCRRLARSINDDRTAETLESIADDYENKARNLQRLN